MVIGMSIFQKYFAKYSDSFTILGGAACDEWFSQASLGFRATKDIDVVLILEAKNIAFFEQLWRFLKDGSYRNWQRSDGTKSFFRFLSPDNQDFPQMIEILARPELVVNVPAGQVIVPIHIDDDISSLSAILLDEDYYHLILNNRRISDNGLPFVIPSSVPAFMTFSCSVFTGTSSALSLDTRNTIYARNTRTIRYFSTFSRSMLCLFCVSIIILQPPPCGLPILYNKPAPYGCHRPHNTLPSPGLHYR